MAGLHWLAIHQLSFYHLHISQDYFQWIILLYWNSIVYCFYEIVYKCCSKPILQRDSRWIHRETLHVHLNDISCDHHLFRDLTWSQKYIQEVFMWNNSYFFCRLSLWGEFPMKLIWVLSRIPGSVPVTFRRTSSKLDLNLLLTKVYPFAKMTPM